MSNNKTAHWVMDYETLCNCFIAVFQHYKDSSIQKVFVVHESRNDFPKFVTFLQKCVTQKEWHISFNGLNFDAQITQKILDNYKELSKLPVDKLINWIYSYAQSVIDKSNKAEFLEYAPYKMKIKQIDLFKLNHWDNKAKMSSLKWIQYSMDWENVEEMPHPHYQPVTDAHTLQEVINYCINDVLSTKEVLVHSKEQIALRQTLTKEYGIDLYSASEPRISKELFLYFLQQRLGWEKAHIKTLRTSRTYIVLADCILPYIEFKTPEFNKVLDYFRTKVITSTKDGFKYSINFKGVKTDYGLGGIHGAIESGVYEAKPGWTIMTSDVTSFYPNLAIKNGFHPEHLPKQEFCQLYEWFFEERKKIPKSDPKNYVYKIILNSTYGLTGDENSFLYDPRMTMQITINGQLLLSKLAEMLSLAIPECQPLMLNTDGLEMMIPESRVEDYMNVCSEWEKLTQLALEHDQYSKMIIRDVNNYMAISTKGKVKCKGAFEWEDLSKKKVATFHKNKSFLIIPKAIHAYFVHGTKPEDFLDQNQDIYDYCGAVKAKAGWHFETRKLINDVPESYKMMTIEEKRKHLEANGWEMSWSDDNWVKSDAVNREANTGLSTEQAFSRTVKQETVVQKTRLQKIVRYFISNTGDKMVKCHNDGREIQVESGEWLQTTINKIDVSKPFDKYDINKKYYLEEIYKEIEGIQAVTFNKATQLSLF
jgi:hypothetical protein